MKGIDEKMEFVNLNNLVSGLTLAEPIFDNKNRLLLKKGAKLERNQINLLKRFGIQGVYVEKTKTLQDMIDTSKDGICRSHFTELKVAVEMGIQTDEILAASILINHFESFLKSLYKILDMPIIHVSIGQTLPTNISEFTKPVPNELENINLLNTYSLENITLLVYHGENSDLVPELPPSSLWYDLKDEVYCINFASVKKKDKYMHRNAKLIPIPSAEVIQR